MSQNFEVLPDEENEEEEFKRLEEKSNALIHLPITTYSLLNHYEFDTRELFEKFLYQDHTLEIFGSANQFPFSMQDANKLYTVKEELGLETYQMYQQIKNKCRNFCIKANCITILWSLPSIASAAPGKCPFYGGSTAGLCVMAR